MNLKVSWPSNLKLLKLVRVRGSGYGLRWRIHKRQSILYKSRTEITKSSAPPYKMVLDVPRVMVAPTAVASCVWVCDMRYRMELHRGGVRGGERFTLWGGDCTRARIFSLESWVSLWVRECDCFGIHLCSSECSASPFVSDIFCVAEVATSLHRPVLVVSFLCNVDVPESFAVIDRFGIEALLDLVVWGGQVDKMRKIHGIVQQTQIYGRKSVTIVPN